MNLGILFCLTNYFRKKKAWYSGNRAHSRGRRPVWLSCQISTALTVESESVQLQSPPVALSIAPLAAQAWEPRLLELIHLPQDRHLFPGLRLACLERMEASGS